MDEGNLKDVLGNDYENFIAHINKAKAGQIPVEDVFKAVTEQYGQSRAPEAGKTSNDGNPSAGSL